MSELERTRGVAVKLREREVDQLLVTEPVNVRYLTGFTGSSGLAIIQTEAAAPHLFFTDFRYDTQSAEQVPAAFRREIAPADLLATVQGTLEQELTGQTGREPVRLGFDDASLTVRQHARLQELLGERFELVACGGLVEGLRQVKDSEEVRRVRAAAELADAALVEVLETGVIGRGEREVAIELELRMRRLGAQAPSFPSIVAFGAQGALPHAEPRDVPIARGALLTIDWGATLDGYCSDCTRTYATGTPSDEALAVYELVLRAQLAGLAGVKEGVLGRDVDALAREVIEEAGHGEHFGHGLGHGVGLAVHEGPRLSPTAGEEPLRSGNIVTIEPGVYLPGRLGVRIEDLAVVTESGCEVLSGLPKELTVVD